MAAWLLRTLAIVAIAAAQAATAAPLVIALDVTPTSMDPHYHYVTQNTSPLSHIFEPLLAMEGDRSLAPALATSWRAIDDTTWRFDLRHGVKFHDGSDFTADDVLFSLKRVTLVPNSPSSFALYVSNVASMRAIDPYTVEIKTKTPDAEFAIGLSQILIMSHAAAAGPAPEGKTTQQLNSGDGLVGTGPYKFVRFIPKERMEVVANPDYWGAKPQWDSVTLKVIDNPTSRAAAVLGGDADIAHVTGENLDRLKADHNVTVQAGDSCFFTYLALDEHEHSPGISEAGGRNPLLDPRVRTALSAAINREALAEHTLSGLAEPAAELGSPSLFGANPDARPEPFDAARARQLLGDAGYPDGFAIKLATPSGLYASDTDIAQAIAAMWTHVGVRTTVDSMPGSVFYARRNKLEFSAYVTFYCDYNGQMSYPLRLLSMTRDLERAYGQVNLSGFSDAKLDGWIVQALSTLADDRRRDLVQQASTYIIREQHQVLPIVRLRYAYATRGGLQFRPRLDTFLTAMQITPAK
jgi:peptide/nickel transport system substrate-binding protein